MSKILKLIIEPDSDVPKPLMKWLRHRHFNVNTRLQDSTPQPDGSIIVRFYDGLVIQESGSDRHGHQYRILKRPSID